MHKLLGDKKRGRLFIISAPAGTGKTTLANLLLKEFPEFIVQSISFTTRLPRTDETNGVHYNFISKEEFQKKIEQGDFLEHAGLYGNQYGTSKKWVEEQLNRGKHVLLVIDTQGAMQLKGKVNAVFIFIKPPSYEILSERLHNRKTETQAHIEQRLAWAKHELEAEKHYDYTIVNDSLPIAYQVLRSILIAEEHKNI